MRRMLLRRFPLAERRVLFAVAFTVALLLGMAGQAKANMGFECDPASCSFYLPDTIDVYVTVDATITDLRGETMVLEFDPAIITPILVEADSLVDGAACPYYSDWLNSGAIGDSIYVDQATLGCSVNGPGRIVHIRFTGASVGMSPLSCRHSSLRNSTNQEIPHTCFQTFITVQAPPVADQASSWGQLKQRFSHLNQRYE